MVTSTPAMLVHPDFEHMPLTDALEVLSNTSPVLAQHALRLLVAGLAPDADIGKLYGDEVLDYIGGRAQVAELMLVRQELRGLAYDALTLLTAYRRDIATREICANIAKRLDAHWLPDHWVQQLVLAIPTPELTDPNPDRSAAVRQCIESVESEASLSLDEYLASVADAAALQMHAQKAFPRSTDSDTDVSVDPMTSVTKQRATDLATSTSVTTATSGSFDSMLSITSPHNWPASSLVVSRATYVNHPFELSELTTDEAHDRLSLGETVLLDEDGIVEWDQKKMCRFHNVLAIRRRVSPQARIDQPVINIEYRLCRSVDSQVLWDKRPGGLEKNQGYFRVYRTAERGDHWRIAARKTIRFSPRPSPGPSPDLSDLGKLLNRLAPAAMSLWVSLDAYGAGRSAQGFRCRAE